MPQWDVGILRAIYGNQSVPSTVWAWGSHSGMKPEDRSCYTQPSHWRLFIYFETGFHVA